MIIELKRNGYHLMIPKKPHDISQENFQLTKWSLLMFVYLYIGNTLIFNSVTERAMKNKTEAAVEGRESLQTSRKKGKTGQEEECNKVGFFYCCLAPILMTWLEASQCPFLSSWLSLYPTLVFQMLGYTPSLIESGPGTRQLGTAPVPQSPSILISHSTGILGNLANSTPHT